MTGKAWKDPVMKDLNSLAIFDCFNCLDGIKIIVRITQDVHLIYNNRAVIVKPPHKHFI